MNRPSTRLRSLILSSSPALTATSRFSSRNALDLGDATGRFELLPQFCRDNLWYLLMLRDRADRFVAEFGHDHALLRSQHHGESPLQRRRQSVQATGPNRLTPGETAI